MSYKYNYSVIIPHFTRDGNLAMLRRAVASVPDRDDIQVIIVDNSLKPIPNDLFTERKNTKVVYSSNERKAGGARNVGMEESDAKWYLFLDADDFYTENAFEIFDSHLDSDNDLEFFCMGGAYSDDLSKRSDRGNRYTFQVIKFLETGDDTGLRINYPSPCAKMVKAELVEKYNIRYDEVPASNDVMFALKVGLKASSVGADARETYIATINRGSITRTQSLANIESVFYVLERYNKMLRENGYPDRRSEMSCIFRSAKYGAGPFFKLFFTALKSGNLFNGWKNWTRTLIRSNFSKKNKENSKYMVKE